MHRLNIALIILLAGCAIAVITSQHHARRLFVELERAQAQSRQLEIDWNQLRVQQTSLATAALIDAKARRDLGMESVGADRTLHLLRDPDSRTVQVGPLPAALARKPGTAQAPRRTDSGAR
jgi:cell division protein FtsL